MIKNTFRTLIKNPLFILIFSFGAILAYAKPLMYEIVENAPAAAKMTTANTFIFAMIVLFAAEIFVVFPIGFNYIYEVCSQTKEKGWASRGMRRLSGKLIVVILIMLPVGFIFPLLLLLFAYQMFTAVTVEDTLGKGLKNTFVIGIRYTLKLVVMLLVIMLPVLALQYSYTVNGVEMSAALEAAVEIYQAIAMSFLMVYSMYSYLNEKEISQKAEDAVAAIEES